MSLFREAKGTRPNVGQFRERCGFATVSAAGSVILGAERGESGAWSLPGIAFDVPEPGTWLWTRLTGRVEAEPFDVRV